jgi:hypothetical protein
MTKKNLEKSLKYCKLIRFIQVLGAEKNLKYELIKNGRFCEKQSLFNYL